MEEDGSLSWSEVYLFPHFLEAGAHAFLRVSTATNATVRSFDLFTGHFQHSQHRQETIDICLATCRYQTALADALESIISSILIFG